MFGGYKGISYPFRINNQGGVEMSTTSSDSATHISESIRQILNTGFLERVMQPDIYSEVQSSLFEPNDISLQQVVKTQIVDTLERLEDRIEVNEDSIELYTENDGSSEVLYATIEYKVIKYQTYYTTTVKVGDF